MRRPARTFRNAEVADLDGPRTFRPLLVRVLCVVVWVLLVVFAVLSVLDGASLAIRSLPPLVLLGVVAFALLWRPGVRVDEESVTLVNVLRDVHVPFPALDGVNTRFALTLEVAGRTYAAWAAPAPGRTSTMGLARRDAAGVAHLGINLDEGLRSSAAPNTDSGGAALFVQHRWQRWMSSGRAAGDHDQATVRWNVPLVVLLLASVAGTVATVVVG